MVSWGKRVLLLMYILRYTPVYFIFFISRMLYNISCDESTSFRFVRNLVRAGWARVAASVMVFALIFIPVKDKKSLQRDASSLGANMESSESLSSVTAKSVIQR